MCGVLCVALILPTLHSRFYFAHFMDAEMETERTKEPAQGHGTDLNLGPSSSTVACGLARMVVPPLC